MTVNVDEETKAGGVFFLSLFHSSFALWGVWGQDGMHGIGRIVVEIIQLSFALCFFSLFCCVWEGESLMPLDSCVGEISLQETSEDHGSKLGGSTLFGGCCTTIINTFITP